MHTKSDTGLCRWAHQQFYHKVPAPCTIQYTAGTYDVQGLTLTECTEPNCLMVEMTFSIHSQSEGALLVLLPCGVEHGPAFTARTLFLLLRRNATDGVWCRVTDVPVGDYQALAYDIEQDGIIHSGSPATRGAVVVSNQGTICTA
jgi:hypothetical protein